MTDSEPQHIDVGVSLNSVTAYKGSAQLQYRTASKLSLSVGTHIVSLRPTEAKKKGESSDRIWSAMDASSLQVQLLTEHSASSVEPSLILHDVTQISRRVEEEVTVQVKHKKDELYQVESTIAELQREKKILQESLTFVQRLKSRLTEGGCRLDSPKTNNALPRCEFYLNTTAWAEMSQFIGSTIQRCNHRLVVIEDLLTKEEEKKSALKKELEGIREDQDLYYRSHVKTAVEATIEVLPSAERQGDAVQVGLQLSFVAPGAQWEPIYDVRVHRSDREIEISYFARVSQTTGVLWDDVELRLSTADPHVRVSPPKDDGVWNISYPAPVKPLYRKMGAMNRAAGASLMAEEAPMMDVMNDNMEIQEMAAPALAFQHASEGHHAVSRAAAVKSSSGGASTFTVAGRVSIQTGDEPVRVCIAVERCSVDLRYTCTPKLDPLVYLSAKAKNTTPFEFLAGKANVFLDQTFVCATELPHTPTEGGDLSIALGVEECVSVKRMKVEETTGSSRHSLFSSSKKKVHQYAYLFEVTSELPNIEVRVIDQYPISSNSDLKITLTEPELPKHYTPNEVIALSSSSKLRVEVDDLQKVTWYVSPALNEVSRFRFLFSVEYPDDKLPTGL